MLKGNDNMIYKRIRDLREDNDYTQQEIANILGMSQRGYAHYEKGDNDIPTEVLIHLAKFYKTSTDYILGLTDEKNITKRRKKKEKTVN